MARPLFVYAATNQKLSPFTGKVDTKWPKGVRLEAAKLFYYSPSASLTLSSSPINGGAFWCSTNTAYSAVPLAERSFQRGYGGRQGA